MSAPESDVKHEEHEVKVAGPVHVDGAGRPRDRIKVLHQQYMTLLERLNQQKAMVSATTEDTLKALQEFTQALLTK